MNLKKIWYRIKEIPIIGNTYQKYIGNKKIDRIVELHNKEIREKGGYYLCQLEEALKESDLVYYAMSGTLLGLIRDKKLLKWDDDIDYGVRIFEHQDWNKLEVVMESHGYKKIREFTFDDIVTEQTYQLEKVTVDFFGTFFNNGKYVSYSYDHRYKVGEGKSYQSCVYETEILSVDKTKKINIDGIEITIPENAEGILACIYNDDWRVPNPNWVSNSGKKCKWLHDKVGIQTMR